MTTPLADEDKIDGGSVKGRAKVSKLCSLGEFDEALDLARGIKHPWYRCQSLSSVAGIETIQEKRNDLIVEAFQAALKQESANRIVTVSAWPLEVLCQNGEHALAKIEIKRLIEIIQQEPHPTRRADAVFTLIQKTHAYSVDLTKVLLKPFKGACSEGKGWKIDRDLRDVAQWVAAFDRDEALKLAEMIFEPRVRRQALRQVNRIQPSKDFGKGTQ